MKSTLPALVLAALAVLGAEELRARSWPQQLEICTARVARHVTQDVWVTVAEGLHLPRWLEYGVRASLGRVLHSPGECSRSRSSRSWATS